MNIIDIFPLTQEQLTNPIEFGKFFLNEITAKPGKKIGFIGEPQSGATVAMHHFAGVSDYKKIGDIFAYMDPRGIADTFTTTLPLFDDLNEIIRAQLPTWMPLIDRCPINVEVCTSLQNCQCQEPDPTVVQEMVTKISQDVEESRKMLLWRSALNLFCLRDLRTLNTNEEDTTWSIFELPYFPVAYNDVFDKMVLLKRRDNWFTDPAFLAHIAGEGVTEETERNLVDMRDNEMADYSRAGSWVFDYTIVNDGTVTDLEAKLIATATAIVG